MSVSTRNSGAILRPNANGLDFREWLIAADIGIRNQFELELRAKKYTRNVRRAWAAGDDPAKWKFMRTLGFIDKHGKFLQVKRKT